ncbi:MAG TPA: PqqD family peptide modification chaperone [Stellaceae bacterium]|nr:PqqD family peptide modification chaperone [Stellaceae bacterium]
MVTDSSISETSVIARAQDVIATEVDGEAVLMSIERGQCYGFDTIGTRVWVLIETPAAVRDVCAALVEEYDVDAETCRRDVLQLLSELAREGLVTIGDGQGR